MAVELFRQYRFRWLRFLFFINGLCTGAILFFFLPHGMRMESSLALRVFAFAFVPLAVLYLLFYLPLSFVPKIKIHRWIAALEGIRYGVLLVDLTTFLIMGVHIYSSFVLQNVKDPHFIRDVGLNFWSGSAVFGLLLISYGFQWFLSYLWSKGSAGRWGTRLKNKFTSFLLRIWRGNWIKRAIRISFWLGLVVVIGWGHWGAKSSIQEKLSRFMPLYEEFNPWLGQGQKQSGLSLHLEERSLHIRYPLKRYKPSPKDQIDKPNIILFGSESVRSDMLNAQDMPRLTNWAKNHPVIRSKAHFSGGHQTWEGLFSLIYSLSGHHRYSFKNRPYPPYPIILLKKLGYRTIGISSSGMRYKGYLPLINHFDRFLDLSRRGGVASDRKINAAVMEEFAKQRKLPASKRKSLFIFVFYYSSHYPFFFPRKHAVFHPFLPRFFNQLLPPKDHHQLLWNRYRNSVHFVDSQIVDLLEKLKPERKAKKLAWAFVGDHGEEFWDHGLYGHGARRMNNARTSTPMLLSYPGIRATTVPLSSHVDIFPTFFSLMGVPLSPLFYSSGHSLLKPQKPNYVQVNGYNFPDAPIFNLITPRYKIFARRNEKLGLEINKVLNMKDQETKWTRKDVIPIARHFMKKVNRFTPGYSLFRSTRITQRDVPGYPFPLNHGPIRTPQNPDLRPWDRASGTKQFVTKQEPSVQYRRRIPIGSYIELVGYHLRSHKIRLGDVIFIEYIFRCIKTPPKDWKFFFHLVLKQEPGFQNVSHIPVLNRYPVWRWKKGEYIRDPHRINTHPRWKEGKGLIRLGLYNSKKRKRAHVPKAMGKSNSALVTTVTLQQGL